MKLQSVIQSALLALLASVAHGAEFTLGWSPSPSSGVTNYVIYAHTNAITRTNLSQTVLRTNVGLALELHFANMAAGRWTFAGTAMRDGVESDPSIPLTIEIPEPMTALRAVILQHATTITASTNWQDVGFFRVKIE